MVERLKHEGPSHSSSDLLKICVKMRASWSAQDFRQAGDTPSGPGAFLFLFFLKTWCTSSSLIFSAGVGEKGVAGGVNGVFFKPAIELIQIVCQLLILHSAGGWCLVIGDVFQTFHTEAESLEENLFHALLCMGLYGCVRGRGQRVKIKFVNTA